MVARSDTTYVMTVRQRVGLGSLHDARAIAVLLVAGGATEEALLPFSTRAVSVSLSSGGDEQPNMHAIVNATSRDTPRPLADSSLAHPTSGLSPSIRVHDTSTEPR
jgi:hypothetical protein